MKRQSSFHRDVPTEALWLLLSLIAGIALGTGVTGLSYNLGTSESSALATGFIVMLVLFVLSEVAYRTGWLPRRLVSSRRQRHKEGFTPQTRVGETQEIPRLSDGPQVSMEDIEDIKEDVSARPLGLPDDAFEQRRPLSGQITKREVRAVSLYSLGLCQDSVVWDIGAGTGSVSVEAALIAHRGTVYAIERDENSMALLRRNVEQWGSGQVHIVPGEAPQALEGLPDPDSVFVGGSGGRLADILDCVAQRLKPQGRVVVNLAALERVQEVHHRFHNLGFATEMVMVHAARGKEMGDGTMRLESLNPVFVVTAWRNRD